ncbi:MAG: ABC transporter permease [Phycisphaerae bacterium]|nr:ABC transporter permease [Phycisphaerae bacterium]
MHARRVAAVVLRQVYLMRGSPVRVLPIVVWCGIDIILWGFISRYLSTITSPGLGLVPALLGAILFWDFFTRVMHGVAGAFLEDVWSRNFLNLFASPLALSEYLAGLVLTSIATSLVGLVVMLVLATAVFGLSFFAYGLMLIPFLLILFLSGIALGVLASAMVLRFGPPAEWLVWPIPALLSPLAAVFYPVATLPKWMQVLSHFLPASYVFESMRAILEGRPISQAALLWAGSLAVGYVLLACWFFTRVYRHAVRTGLLARYSAETVS